MPTVSVIYHSGSGHTTKLAESVVKGAAAVPGITANLIAISGDDIIKGRYQNDSVLAQLDASDAIIFGSPTYMGGPSAQFKAFADATAERWYFRKWVNKIAGGFTISSSPSGDKLSTIHYFYTLAMQQGMLWVGLTDLPGSEKGINRLGSHSGAMAQAGQESTEVAPNEADRLTGETLGRRVAESTARWLRGAQAPAGDATK